MRVLSLFCGAGGLDLGLIEAGHKVVWANDNDADAVQTYRANLGGHVFLADIEGVSTADIPAGDVVVGGFPCQGFSLANLRRSGKDDRNKLYREFLRIVTEKQPLYFLAENVRGILSLEGGSVIRKIVQDFSLAGYRVKVDFFNAANFGVPQSRYRVIIAGTREDIPTLAEFEFPKPTHGKPGNKEGLPRWISIAEGLNRVPDPDKDPHSVPNQEYSRYKVTNRNFTGHRTTDPSKPSPTILARGNGKGGVCAIQHPNNHRRMSVRESATIQSFPMQFRFFGAMNSAYRQVGNAVAVEFARHLGLELAKAERKLPKTLRTKRAA